MDFLEGEGHLVGKFMTLIGSGFRVKSFLGGSGALGLSPHYPRKEKRLSLT